MHSVEEMNRRPHDRKLMRMGLMTALVIGIHNFPEGIATFMSAIDNPTLGIAIAAAIAIHNIPEGIAVSVPIYYATGSRRKAFLLSLSSGLAEPIGALLAYAVLLPFLSPTLLGCLFGFVAGIMVFISLDELLPAAEEYGEHHISIYGVVTGMALIGRQSDRLFLIPRIPDGGCIPDALRRLLPARRRSVSVFRGCFSEGRREGRSMVHAGGVFPEPAVGARRLC